MAKSKLNIKLVKAELEKFKTLDEKKQFLEKILSKIKNEKLKLKVKKLLDTVQKHLNHEIKLTKETPLEEKLAERDVPVEIITANPLPEIKYFSRRGQSGPSNLEKEVASAPFAPAKTPVIGIKYEPPNRSYEHQQRIESLRFYLSEQQQLVRRFTPDTWQAMPEEQRRQVFNVVQQSLGLTEVGGAEDYGRIINYISDVFSSGKPGEKYKIKP